MNGEFEDHPCAEEKLTEVFKKYGFDIPNIEKDLGYELSSVEINFLKYLDKTNKKD